MGRKDSGQRTWSAAYAEVVERQGELVSRARGIAAGFSATSDALHTIDQGALERLLAVDPASFAAASTAFAAGMTTVQEWLATGRDGEIFVDDESAEELLEQLVGPARRRQGGGTSVQAAWSWSECGLTPMLSLRNRGARQLSVLADRVQIASADGSWLPVDEAPAADGRDVPANHVLELAAGTRAAGVVIERSSRIMVIFARKRLQLDPSFAAASPARLRGGVGLVSGLNGLGAARVHDVPVVAETLHAWRDAGARMIHLELADYRDRHELAQVLDLCAEAVDSIGMNAAEFDRLVTGADSHAPALPHRAAALAAARGFSRVVVHGDRWAMSVHSGDPAVESLALRTGSLAAANRAENGTPRAQWRLPHGARFSEDLPPEGPVTPDYRATVVSTPYLTHPATTIGLGDTFVSGDLLVHAGVG